MRSFGQMSTVPTHSSQASANGFYSLMKLYWQVAYPLLFSLFFQPLFIHFFLSLGVSVVLPRFSFVPLLDYPLVWRFLVLAFQYFFLVSRFRRSCHVVLAHPLSDTMAVSQHRHSFGCKREQEFANSGKLVQEMVNFHSEETSISCTTSPYDSLAVS